MGAGNAQRALIHWQNLNGAPMRVLIQMALIILDEDKTPKWWGGRGPLAQAIGHPWPASDDKSEDAERIRKASGRALDRALKSLRDAGAITTAERPRGGRRAEYWVHFDGPRTTETVA